ncbi:MAG: nuclear transport factor 2 family protein [Ilumatobacteraceae bacterium]
MGMVLDAMCSVLNSHDLDGFVALFAEDYRSEQPVHPGREFTGSEQVRENWCSVFAGVPDFHAELVLAATTGDGVEIGEWRWSGTHLDGAPFAMRGVTVLGVENQRVAWGRLYMEPVDHSAADIDGMVQEVYRPPGA